MEFSMIDSQMCEAPNYKLGVSQWVKIFNFDAPSILNALKCSLVEHESFVDKKKIL